MRSFLATVLMLASTSAWAGTVPVKAVKASSHYTESGNYEPGRLADGKAGTSWVEGDSGSGLGAWAELDLGGEHAVAGIKIWAGDWYSYDSWTQASRPKEIELKFSDGTTELMQLEDKKEAQMLTFKERKTSTIRIRFKQVYTGSTWSDTGISEVQVLAAGSTPSKATASTEAKEDGDGSYTASNAVDGLADTMWCEGNADGDGTGEYLSINLGSSQEISKMEVINGMGGSLMLWLNGNRATTATLTFSDGKTAEVEFTNTMKPQEITFPTAKTSSVKVTFTGIAKGKKFNDLCISEVRFSK
jgi:hypothetical protein